MHGGPKHCPPVLMEKPPLELLGTQRISLQPFPGSLQLCRAATRPKVMPLAGMVQIQ